MNRRELLSSVAAGLAWPSIGLAMSAPQLKAGDNRLTPPAKGKIPVAFVLGQNPVIIDFCGPWGVFESAHIMSRGTTMEEMMPFETYTVSDHETVFTSGDMKILPNRTLLNAGQPKVIVLPAHKASDAEIAWIKKASETADVVMSVCTGAFVLARTGLLAGKEATTHHGYYDDFASQFPDIKVKRGLRFVEGPKISTGGGLSCGIDLALRVVERYFGREGAQYTADVMEYQGKGWIV
jgi:transcriptional regulator GlxA family with amidase domain